MPTDYKKTVLLGDRDPERSALLVDIIENDFRAKVVRVEFFDDLDTKMVEAVKASATWKLVLLAAELQETANRPDTILPKNFYHIAKLNFPNVGCVYTDAEPPDSDVVGFFIPSFHVPPSGTPDRRKVIIDRIDAARIGGLKLWKKPTIKLDDDPILIEQVGALSSDGDSQKAKEVLAYLIRDFQSEHCDTATVSKLIQGASGAKVFRFRPEPAYSKVNERVLKIAHYRHEWKLNAEVTKHLKAQKTLGNEYKEHVPEIESFDTGPDQPSQHITSYEDWRAIAYDFLGGVKFRTRGNCFGKFMDLETALIGSHRELQQKTAETPFEKYFATEELCVTGRKHFFEVLLNWLCNNWYLKYGHRENKEALWDYSDGPDDRFVRFPPYQLPKRSKRYILNFLDERKAQMGERFFEDWGERHKVLREFVAGSEAELSRLYTLAGQHSVILSPTHGDLNSNNILLWLDEAHPFLIDFPFYQESGHALQDFARLEVEVKFILMDRQADSSPKDLPAFDYTHTQIPLWHALEKHLLRERWDTGEFKLQLGAFDKNVKLSYELVHLIRTKAKVVQRQQENKRRIGFWAEYRLALLYHTLRVIGYDTLSPFKRLLAVFSAAQLLGQCRLK
jgi:hypothetical protein